jgi:hypothetical protein
MDKDTEIELCGAFSITDRNGVAHEVMSIRIFNESYGVIDVFVQLSASASEARLDEDDVVIGQIMQRLKGAGYVGPDFGRGDAGLQDDCLMVLEAPEAFNRFAATKGWRDLAASFETDDERLAHDPATSELMQALMRKLTSR